jgi:hypothetical protein
MTIGVMFGFKIKSMLCIEETQRCVFGVSTKDSELWGTEKRPDEADSFSLLPVAKRVFSLMVCPCFFLLIVLAELGSAADLQPCEVLVRGKILPVGRCS